MHVYAYEFDHAPDLDDIDRPVLQQSNVFMTAGRPTPPWQVVYHMESGEWEVFIREWATGLPTNYVQIKRLGGANDRGIDVAAFKTRDGFEGAWDCFQGKHYAQPLKMSNVAPEILKLFRHVACGHYVIPDSYQFLAPQGCSNSLEKLLSTPSEMKSTFLQLLVAGNPLVSGLTPLEIDAVARIATATNFSMFNSVQFDDVIATHRRTHYFPIRFGGPLHPRPQDAALPAGIGPDETVYVQQLVDVYVEKFKDPNISGQTVVSHPRAGGHFQRQRVSFYRAEALRKFAESSVPPGTFEDLQEDVFIGVVDAAERPYGSGFERLSHVLQSSGALRLQGHQLMSVSNEKDVKGICHQLANNSRLNWSSEMQS